MAGRLWFITGAVAVLFGLLSISCVRSDDAMIGEKVSSQLVSQVDLRKAQIAQPTPERLKTMQQMGMNVDNLAVQRVFIYLARELSPEQTNELESLGIVPYPDSWIPPVGGHPAGYLLADIPVDSVAALTRKNYVISVDTAEREFQPQEFRPQ